MIAEAKKEGELLYYAALNIDDATVIANKFKEQYPFIDVKIYRANNNELLTRSLSENRAKRYAADVISINIEMMTVMQHAGIIGKYLSPERAAFAEGFKDNEGYWTSHYFITYSFIYNTRLVPPERIPKNYDELLSPWWKGKLGYPTGNPAWFGKMIEVMGEERGLNFMKKLAAQNLSYRNGLTLSMNLVIAAEISASVFGQSLRAQQLKEQGAPVDWAPLDPYIAAINSIAVTSHAPHPNAARLFIDYILSKEGQTVIANLSRIPSRQGVEPRSPKLVRGLKLYPIKPLATKEYDAMSKLHRQIFN